MSSEGSLQLYDLRLKRIVQSLPLGSWSRALGLSRNGKLGVVALRDRLTVFKLQRER